MFTRKSISALLTGASLAALAVTTGRATAGTTQTFTGPVIDWVTNTNWLNIDSGSNVGTFTNSATIVDGLGNPFASGALGVAVIDGATVGTFVNDGTILAVESSVPFIGNTNTPSAAATGLLIEGNLSSVTNNNSLGALAWGIEVDATSSAQAEGEAIGAFFNFFSVNDPTSANFTNNGDVEVTASGTATSLDEEAEANAQAYGVLAFFEDRATSVSSSFGNTDSIDVGASATADAEDGANAYATADGISQDFEDVDSGLAIATNDGTIEVSSSATATSNYYYAFADADVDGIDQEIERNDPGYGVQAIVNATNSATMTVSGTASASITYGAAMAEVDAVGIEQDAIGGLTLSSAQATNLADITVSALANVDATVGTYNMSDAEAAGISQNVAGGEDAQVATALADNQASIAVSATSSASGTYVGTGYSGYSGVSVALGAGINQDVYDAESLSATATNSASIDVLAKATRDFTAGTYSAAVAFGAGVNQEVDGGTTGVASFVNTGSVDVEAIASNNFDYYGIAASMAAAGGSSQNVYDVLNGSAEFENGATGSMSIMADASASGLIALSDAMAVGANQSVYASGDGSTANLSASNLGTMMVSSVATADSTYYASAEAEAIGIAQDGEADVASLVAANSGDLSVSASATASTDEGLYPSPGFAIADINDAGGIEQDADGDASALASATNSATIGVSAAAVASASTYAMADGDAFGVEQYADAYDASAIFSNTGSVSVAATSKASSDYVAMATSYAVGVEQDADGDAGGDAVTSALAQTVNDDTIFAGAEATAGGLTAEATYAFAGADAVGLSQDVWYSDTLETQLTNNGTVAATGTATATGNAAIAFAEATGYIAEAFDSEGANMMLRNNNTGAIWAIAEATATGDYAAYASAYAVGAMFDGEVGQLELDAVNKGLIAASALATATASGEDIGTRAYATGVEIENWDGLGGTFKNGGKGMILANAIASGPNSSAWALGVNARSYDNGIYIRNNGLISAYAEGAAAQATAIALNGGETMIGAPVTPTAVATIENHGDVWAGISTDGGTTVLRGNAINTENSWNAVTILLENNSPANIFGNIDISDDDQIIVQDGTTNFDGIINPDMMLEGSLTVRSKGTLVMLNENDEEGASRAYVDTFTMGKKGKLQLNLTPDNAAGAYPTIATNTANLGGKLKANYAGTFYGNSIVYENVIDAGTRSGKFKNVVDNSVLLETKALYDNAENVDIKVKRIGFGDVDGLTENQQAAGDGIDKVYNDLPNKGPFSNIVKDLFTLNGAQYAAAMDQLAGAEYAQLMQSVLRSTGQLNASVTDRMDCSINTNVLESGADARKGCFDPNKFQVWARVGGTWNDSDGDIEAPGYSENQTTVYVGGDYAINTNVFVGIAGGYLNSSLDFDDWGGRNGASMGYDGGQIALYGGYDDGVWYGRNILSYGFYSGDSRREFGITTTPKSLTGEYDTNVVSYYGEVGRRFQLMENVGATPFLGLGLAGAGIGSFTEKDPHGTGAALQVRGTDSNSVASTLGFRVNGYWGGFRPELTLAWQHEFADARQTVDMSFAEAPKGANFSVVSSDPGSDALIVGLGGSYAVGPSSAISLRYDGTFWSGYSSQELSARWTSKF